VVALLALAGPAFSVLADDDTAFGKVHWGTRRVPFTLRIGDNVDASWETYLKRGAKQWTKSDIVKMRIVGGSSSARTCGRTDGQVEVCNSDYGNTGWLGMTNIFFTGKHIYAATVKLNEYYFSQRQGQYNTRQARIHTMCHELGHAVGLPHPKNTSKSCVNDEIPLLETTLKPSAQDFKNLAKLYDHRDRDVTVRRGKASAASASVADPTISGAETGDDGRHTVTETRLPDGSTMVTFITWVDEGA
jgi:hypothetical protein